MQPGTQHRRLDQALRRHDPAVHQHDPQVRLVGQVRRFRRSQCHRCGHRRQHPRALLRNDLQSRRLDLRPRRDCARRRPAGIAADRRQHHRHPLPLPPHRAWRDARRPFGHQVPDRQRHRHRRGRGRLRQVRLVGIGKFPSLAAPEPAYHGLNFHASARRHGLHLPLHRRGPARSGHDDEPAGRALHADGDRDAVAAHAAPCRECADRGRVAGAGPAGRSRHLSRPEVLALPQPRQDDRARRARGRCSPSRSRAATKTA